MIRPLGIFALTLAYAPGLFAEDIDKSPLDRTANDRQILDTLKELHDKGAALFDGGDHAGCYRLFQGTLLTVRILLPKEMQEEIDRGLADAARQPAMANRAMALHKVIEEVRKRLRPTAGPKSKGMLLNPPRAVGADLKAPEQLPMPNPDKVPGKIDPPIVPVNTPQKGGPAPITTAPPSDDPTSLGPKLPFTPIIPKPDGK
jgi:hypothetical protein